MTANAFSIKYALQQGLEGRSPCSQVPSQLGYGATLALRLNEYLIGPREVEQLHRHLREHSENPLQPAGRRGSLTSSQADDEILHGFPTAWAAASSCWTPATSLLLCPGPGLVGRRPKRPFFYSEGCCQKTLLGLLDLKWKTGLSPAIPFLHPNSPHITLQRHRLPAPRDLHAVEDID